jgi:hypothetical protein
MKLRSFSLLITICIAGGALFFLLHRKWLIVHFTMSPMGITAASTQSTQLSTHKTIKLFYWKNEKWLQEEISIIWDEQNMAQNARQVLKQWLATMHNEHLLAPHVALESLALSSLGNEAYISFDRSLFSPEWPIIKKWLILEGLFKTILAAQLPLHSVTLLVHNRPMEDEHLELSQPLPVQERL